MLGDRHELPRFQSEFYRENYHKMVRCLFVSTLIMLLLILFIVYLEVFVPAVKYYASTTNGQLIELTAYTR